MLRYVMLCDVRLTSRNASVTLCNDTTNDFCRSSSDVTSPADSTLITTTKVCTTGCANNTRTGYQSHSEFIIK